MQEADLVAALAAAVPFNRHLALEYGRVEPGRAEVRLLARDGKTRPPVEVRLMDESSREVATMKVLWNVRKKRAPALGA